MRAVTGPSGQVGVHYLGSVKCGRTVARRLTGPSRSLGATCHGHAGDPKKVDFQERKPV